TSGWDCTNTGGAGKLANETAVFLEDTVAMANSFHLNRQFLFFDYTISLNIHKLFFFMKTSSALGNS
ncbi:MAG: hypothetical protein PHD54_11310, partial [Desulfuromonadaceae bacterium]|nr:hypothetical protein [Desulfuromonadaceae bacterium]